MADAEREMSVAPKRAVATMRAIFKCRMGFLRFVSVILNPTRRFAQSRCREAEERVHPTFKESSQSHVIGSNFANYVQMLPFRAVSAREKHDGRKARLSFPSIADIVPYRRAPPLRPGAAVGYVHRPSGVPPTAAISGHRANRRLGPRTDARFTFRNRFTRNFGLGCAAQLSRD
jgi:hypothetical protein